MKKIIMIAMVLISSTQMFAQNNKTSPSTDKKIEANKVTSVTPTTNEGPSTLRRPVTVAPQIATPAAPTVAVPKTEVKQPTENATPKGNPSLRR
ncbi:MAG: hypothetical protein IPK62_12720 [Bacteroidetes bacterium]|nr:hypothetical protein [Bacteroidota bacterium]